MWRAYDLTLDYEELGVRDGRSDLLHKRKWVATISGITSSSVLVVLTYARRIPRLRRSTPPWQPAIIHELSDLLAPTPDWQKFSIYTRRSMRM